MKPFRFLNVVLAFALLAGALAALPASTVRASGTTYIVDSTADGIPDGTCGASAGDCTLRDAINLAFDPGDAINIIATGTITLTEGELTISNNLTIIRNWR